MFAVARFDGDGPVENPTERFVLTRGFWTEEEASEEAAKLNAEASRPGSRYFVLPVRVDERQGL